MRLYGLVRTGDRNDGHSFLQETRGMSGSEAKAQVAKIAMDLGVV